MQFIKENLFLVALAGAVLVVGGILVAMNFGTSKQIEQSLAQRQTLDSEIKSLASAKPANADTVLAEKKRVESVQNMQKQVVEETISWNVDDFRNWAKDRYTKLYPDTELPRSGDLVLPVIHLKTLNGDVLPAFPYDADRYAQLGLTYTFTEEYRNAMLSLLKRLKPTSPPSQEEIFAETTRAKKQLEIEAAKKGLAEGAAAAPSASPAAPAMTMWAPMAPAAGGTGASASIDAQAQARGLLKARKHKAQQGRSMRQNSRLIWFSLNLSYQLPKNSFGMHR